PPKRTSRKFRTQLRPRIATARSGLPRFNAIRIAHKGSNMKEKAVSRQRLALLSDELAYVSARELAARIQRRDLSPVEVVEVFIRRIEARNPSLNALVYLGFDSARARAKEAEGALMAGEQVGPLHGVPSALKDLFDFKPGWPSSLGGIRALKHNV